MVCVHRCARPCLHSVRETGQRHVIKHIPKDVAGHCINFEGVSNSFLHRADVTMIPTSGCDDAILALGKITLGPRARAPVLSHWNQLVAALGSSVLPFTIVQ